MAIILNGIISDTLGGYICLRGFAKISDLIQISESKTYQREVIGEHIENIKKFYEKGKYLFFPEIILGCNLSNYSLCENLRNNEPFVDSGIKYKYLKTDSKGYLTIDEDAIKLHRIDGNHRLNAYEKGMTALEEVPFCILFLAEEQAVKDAKVIFNNINYKNRSLREENNLKNIFDESSKYPYTDDEIKNNYGENYKKTKYLIKELEKNNKISDIKKIVNEFYREISFKLINTFLSLGINEVYLNTESLYKAIVDVLDAQKEKIDLGLFIAYVYYKLFDNLNSSNQKYKLFTNWVRKNNIIKIKDICSEDVINIFNNILDRKKRQIFVSMPFGTKKCDNMFNIIQKVVEKISQDYNIDTPLVLRIDELQGSSTYKIIEKIENAIEDTGYLIAILNYQNPNVYHEIGYAMGYFKGKGLESNVLLVLEEPDNKDDWDKDEYKVAFNLQGYKQLRYKIHKEFEEKLEENLLLHYGLK